MCGIRCGLGLIGTALLGLAGCWTTDTQIKPPPNPEEYVIPPADDPRFAAPPAFPEKTLNQGLPKKDKELLDPTNSLRPQGRNGFGGGGLGGGASGMY
jgi:hypothetical protein